MFNKSVLNIKIDYTLTSDVCLIILSRLKRQFLLVELQKVAAFELVLAVMFVTLLDLIV